MSLADITFINMCKDILENGTSTEGEKVRPHWPDGTSAYTIKKFGVVNRYDLRKEFPLLTLRKTALKSGVGSGSGRPTTATSCAARAGMNGQMQRAPSVRLMGIRLARNMPITNVKMKICQVIPVRKSRLITEQSMCIWIRWMQYCMI